MESYSGEAALPWLPRKKGPHQLEASSGSFRDTYANTRFGSFLSILVPEVKQGRVDHLINSVQKDLPSPDPNWLPREGGELADIIRARLNNVEHPLRRDDEKRLRDFHWYCREGNLNEVRVMMFHYPQLALLTDQYGWTALHHSAMSQDAKFVGHVLQLYRSAKHWTLSSKCVTYNSEEELQEDGLSLNDGLFRLSKDCQRRGYVVKSMGEDSKAASQGVLEGDLLCAVEGDIAADEGDKKHPSPALKSKLKVRKLPSETEIVRVTEGGHLKGEHRFPCTLRFCRPAHADIMSKDSWRLYGIQDVLSKEMRRMMGPGFMKIREMLVRERKALVQAAKNAALLPPPRPEPPSAAEILWAQAEESAHRSRAVDGCIPEPTQTSGKAAAVPRMESGCKHGRSPTSQGGGVPRLPNIIPRVKSQPTLWTSSKSSAAPSVASTPGPSPTSMATPASNSGTLRRVRSEPLPLLPEDTITPNAAASASAFCLPEVGIHW
eukprot:TRINITY_DN5505_c0_g1_i1.p1 TRINITY_DN5505_c0_g1~~TRINITY_DN5505_c0_g1_i1.p1  ORF type:complete len:492 (-),score=66.62 TRINITY_DN5505_c0_g1_i1:178-1653(-)